MTTKITAPKINVSKCYLFVSGLDMNCPVCGTRVHSGEQHECGTDIKPARRKPAKKAKR